MPALTVSDVAESSERAAARIAGLVRETPLDYSPAFSAARSNCAGLQIAS